MVYMYHSFLIHSSADEAQPFNLIYQLKLGNQKIALSLSYLFKI